MNGKETAKWVGGGAMVLILLAIIIGCMVSITRVPAGYAGVVYNMNGGIEENTLSQGWHLVFPTKKVKQFTIGNEQIVLTKDEREGSEGDDSFRVSTSDDASVAISFQMSYRFIEADLPDTYKKFKGMDGTDIVEKRVKSVLKSKISEITTDYSIMDIYSGNRSEINTKITDYLNGAFKDMYGIEVIDASIIDCHPDKQLKAAINNRIEALQKKEQAAAEQETAKVEAETALIKAKNAADIKRTEAEAAADATKIAAEAEAAANKKIANSITDKLIQDKLADARNKHGWVTVQGADSVVTKDK